VEIFYAKAPEADYVDAAIQSVLRIHTQVSGWRTCGSGGGVVLWGGDEEL